MREHHAEVKQQLSLAYTVVISLSSHNNNSILMLNCLVFSGLIVSVGSRKKFAECNNISCKISVSGR